MKNGIDEMAMSIVITTLKRNIQWKNYYIFLYEQGRGFKIGLRYFDDITSGFICTQNKCTSRVNHGMDY